VFGDFDRERFFVDPFTAEPFDFTSALSDFEPFFNTLPFGADPLREEVCVPMFALPSAGTIVC
jgi:hypothetical protein